MAEATAASSPAETSASTLPLAPAGLRQARGSCHELRARHQSHSHSRPSTRPVSDHPIFKHFEMRHVDRAGIHLVVFLPPVHWACLRPQQLLERIVERRTRERLEGGRCQYLSNTVTKITDG